MAEEYDNSELIPFLKEIAAAEEGGGLHTDDTVNWGDNPGKIRQRLYIAKLAKKDRGGNLVLTDAGRELIQAV